MKIEFDEGFAFGRGAFETIKIVDRVPLFLDRHLSRLDVSLEFLGIEKRASKDEIYGYIEKTDKENFALKVMVSEKNIILTDREDSYRENYKAFRLGVAEARKSSTSKLVYHKSLSYYENILEHKLAISKGYDSTLFLNERGEVTETDFANIFIVKEGKISTPSLESGLLRGTMRDYLLENYPIGEKTISLADLEGAEEVFISNSLMGVRSVESIDGRTYKKFDQAEKILSDLKKIGF